jgi:predicted  nucleic acid-binding Zn-ribbon protein
MSDNFSQKEILLQLMSKVDTLNNSLTKQELLLNSINAATVARDEKIKDLRVEVKVLQDEMVTLTDKVSSLKAFNKTIVAIWSGFILLISLFGKEIFNKLF